MSSSFIIFICFGALLYIFIAGGIGMYIAGEKGRNTKTGFFVGALIPILGWIILAITRPSNEFLVKELHDRDLITKQEYDKTIEFAIAKDKK